MTTVKNAGDDKSLSRGLVPVLGATAVAGASGYLIQLAAARFLPDAQLYLSFSIFWSTLYLIGSAVGGIQQEVARATRPYAGDQSAVRRSPLRRFIVAAVVVAVLISVVAGLMIAPSAFDGTTLGMILALAVGLTGYVLTAVFTGLMYGVHRLRVVATLIAVDASLRTLAVIAAFFLGATPDIVALAIALPFGAAVGVVWLAARGTKSSAYVLDVSPRELARGAAHTVLAAGATGLMVTGMPLLFRLALTDATTQAVAALTLVVTLTRAPFIIPLTALQSFLTVSYRDAPGTTPLRVRRYLLIAICSGSLATGLAWFTVPSLTELISVGEYHTTPLVAAVVVASAVLVGCICLTGPALLARGDHRAYAAGWVVAAVVTVATLFLLPAGPEARAIYALLVGPAAGLLTHVLLLFRAPSGLQQSVSDRE